MSATALSAKTRSDLGWDALLVELSSRARTRRGANLCRQTAPLPTIAEAHARMAEIDEARALYDRGEPLPLDGVRELDMVVERAERSGVLTAEALCDVAATLQTVARVLSAVRMAGRVVPKLLARATGLDPLDTVQRTIAGAFESLDAAGSSGPPRLADHASPELASLRRRAQKAREELEKKLDGLLDASDLAPHLQDRFYTLRDERYVVPVRIEARNKVGGIVHGVSSSGQTVFVEPEGVVELNNKMRLSELSVAEEERRILLQLSELVGENQAALANNLTILAELDRLDAGARLAIDLRATACTLTEGGAFDLRRARHPLLQLQLGGTNCVASDLAVRFGSALVISGPNAGGKTVALKTIGLLCVMARAGLPVSAQEGSQLPLIDEVITDVGDDQSLERNLSTFSAHVLAMQEGLKRARPGVLLLVDEIAAGTDPDQGAALAQALLEAFADRGATVVVTTHYERLKALAVRDARFANASVGFDLERLAPTFEIHLGIPGASGAVMVARRLGLDGAVCARTDLLLSDEQLGLEQLLTEIERERQEMSRARNDAQEQLREAERVRALAEQKLNAANDELQKARKGEHDQAIAILREARAELEQARLDLKRKKVGASQEEIKQAREELDEAARKVNEAQPEKDLPGRPVLAHEIKIGLAVWVERLGGGATVTALPKGDRVPVAAGPLKLQVPLAELRLVDRNAAKQHEDERRKRSYKVVSSAEPAPSYSRRGGRPELDVRGERVDVAIGIVEKFLDDAMQNGDGETLIIHGLGTGALKDKIRDHLLIYPGVTAQRPGKPNEGGDGVTIVELGG